MDPKIWYMSATVRGALTTIIMHLFIIVGLNIEVEQVREIVDAVLTLLAVAGVAAGGYSLRGRVRADRGIKWRE